MTQAGWEADLEECRKLYPGKFAEEARVYARIHRGDHIFIGTACGEPQYLVKALIEYVESNPKVIFDAEVFHIWTVGVAPYTDEKFRDNFRHNSFFIGENTREAVNEGLADKGMGVAGHHKGGGWGVYGRSESGHAGVFSGSLWVTGSCIGCVLTYAGLNDSSGALETGDLVALSGVSDPLAGTAVPLLRVQRADARNANTLVGVVQSRGRAAGSQGVPGHEMDNIVPADGPAAPGDYVFIAVQGLVQVKANAEGGAVEVGETLTLTRSLAGHAGRVLERGTGLQIGRAMEGLEEGRGLIWVMLDLETGL